MITKPSARFWLFLLFAPLIASLSAPLPVAAQGSDTSAPSTKRLLSKNFTLDGGKVWIDTGITLQPGQHLVVNAAGKLRYSDAKADNGPDGLTRGFKDLLRVLPFNDAGRGAVLARIGDADVAQPFLIGVHKDFVAPAGGKLSLGINQANNDTGSGSYKVSVDVYATEANATVVVVKQVSSMPGIDNNLFARIPRRISDKQNNPGDMVNFLILGTEDQMRKVFTSAGWVKVDTDVKDTILHGFLESMSKDSYLTMPMSQLYLFGRPQDYGWAHAEPISVVASRNHLRVWKAPSPVNGQTFWAGAATHDIGFERDQRNNGITHKIDPDIDLERDYVEKTLSSTGLVAEVTHFLPNQPLKEAKTATGGSFHSNGQVLVLKLASSGTRDLSANFGAAFCNLLQNENPDGGAWQSCSAYLGESAGPAPASIPLPPLNTAYRVLIIPGILSSCQENTKAFQQGQDHLREKHGMTVEFLQTPNAGSTSNGKLIADYLKNSMQKDRRKFIVVSYSKGSPDVLEALAADSAARAAVAAHVTVSGAIGGSPVADTLPQFVDRYASQLNFGSCKGNLSEAYQSLRQDVRQRFLSEHPNPAVPSFSLVAVSDLQSTSKMMMESWRLLSAIDPRTDGQLLRDDALIPGGALLGTLHADHLAVALDYGGNTKPGASTTDPNHFPRAAVLEAAVRVASDSISH